MNKDILAKLQAYFSHYPIREYQKGAFILTADEDPRGVLFLEEGSVEQYDFTPEGTKITVNIFKSPAFFPMSWAINQTPNAYFFAAVDQVRAREASAKDTVDFLRDNPDVLLDLLSRVYRGTDSLLRRLILATHGVASNRLVFELLIDASRFGKELPGGKRLVKSTQQALAERSGLARETVNRELHKLETQGLITLTKQGIVLELDKLEEQLNFTTA